MRHVEKVETVRFPGVVHRSAPDNSVQSRPIHSIFRPKACLFCNGGVDGQPPFAADIKSASVHHDVDY